MGWVKEKMSAATLRNYFFTPRTASFAALATRNLTTVLAGILIFSCVLGLKPIRAFLFCFTSFPKPGRTNSPFFFDLFVGQGTERIKKRSSRLLVCLSGLGERNLKFCFSHSFEPYRRSGRLRQVIASVNRGISNTVEGLPATKAFASVPCRNYPWFAQVAHSAAQPRSSKPRLL
jgi:hypothetical protein